MLAKFKKTGQVLNVPDEFYKANQSLYEPANSPAPVQTTVQQPGNQGGDVLTQGKDLVMSLLSPFLETGKRIGGAAYAVGQRQAIDMTKKASDDVIKQLALVNDKLKTETDPNKKKSLISQSRLLSDALGGVTKTVDMVKTNSFLSNEELQQIHDNPRKELIKQGGRGLEMVSWGVPGGGFKNSAIIGALQSAGRQLEENQRIDPTQTAISAGIGGVTGKVLDKVLGMGKATEEAGNALRKSVIKPKVDVGPAMFGGEQEIIKIAEEMGLKGTPEQMKQQIGEKYAELLTQHNSILANSTKQKSANIIKNMLKQRLGESGFAGEAYDKIVDSQIQRIGNEKVGASFISKLKTKISNELGSKFNNPTTARQEVLREMWNVLDDAIAKIEPGAKQTTLEMSKLYKVIPGIADQAKAGISVPVPLAGGSIRTSAAPLLGAKDAAGRTLQKAGGAMDKVLSKLGGKIGPVDTRTAAVEGATALLNGPQGQTEQTQPQVTEPIQPIETPAATQTDAQTQKKELAKKALQIALVQDLAKGGKHITQITAIGKALGLDNTDGLSATEKQAVEQAKVGLNLVDTLEGEYKKVQGEGLTAKSSGLGLLGGVKGSVAAASQTSASAAAYDQTKQAFLSKLSRASGEKGVLTDQDIKRIEKAIPSFYDTPQVAAEKLALIRQIIGGAIESKTAAGSSNNLDITSLVPKQ